MEQTIYDPLDLTSGSYDSKRAEEAVHLSTALLIYYLLRGRTPLLSQTQGFDSPTILTAAQEGPAGAAFRWLVRQGHLRVALFGKPSLAAAFIAALDNPDFVFLSWPELNGPNPTVDRGALKDCLARQKLSADMPEAVCVRAGTLLALNDAVAATRRPSCAQVPKTPLSTHVAAARAAAPRRSAIRRTLQRLVDLKSDQWSKHFAELNSIDLPHDDRTTVLSILDSCYNLVLGDSLGAREVILRGSERKPIDIMWAMMNGAVHCDGLVSLDDNIVEDFERVGWIQVADFITHVEELSMNERERAAEATRLLVRVAVAGRDTLGFSPLLDGLYQGVLWGGIASAGAAAASPIPPTPKQFAIAFLTGFLPAFLTSTAPIRPVLQEHQISRLERRYSAVLQGEAK